IGQIRHTRLCRWIGPPPIVQGLIPNNQRAILVGTTESPSTIIGVAVVWTKDGDRQARVENRRSGNLPASEHGIDRSVGAAPVIFAAPERHFVHAYEVQAVTNVHCGRTVVRVEIVTILDGESIEAGISYRIVTRRISQ